MKQFNSTSLFLGTLSYVFMLTHSAFAGPFLDSIKPRIDQALSNKKKTYTPAGMVKHIYNEIEKGSLPPPTAPELVELFSDLNEKYKTNPQGQLALTQLFTLPESFHSQQALREELAFEGMKYLLNQDAKYHPAGIALAKNLKSKSLEAIEYLHQSDLTLDVPDALPGELMSWGSKQNLISYLNRGLTQDSDLEKSAVLLAKSHELAAISATARIQNETKRLETLIRVLEINPSIVYSRRAETQEIAEKLYLSSDEAISAAKKLIQGNHEATHRIASVLLSKVRIEDPRYGEAITMQLLLDPQPMEANQLKEAHRFIARAHCQQDYEKADPTFAHFAAKKVFGTQVSHEIADLILKTDTFAEMLLSSAEQLGALHRKSQALDEELKRLESSK